MKVLYPYSQLEHRRPLESSNLLQWIRGKGVETSANPLPQKKDVRLKMKEAKEFTSAEKFSKQVSRKGNRMKRKRSCEVLPSGYKHPKKGSLVTNPFL